MKKIIKDDKTLLNNVIWHDIDKNGYVNISLLYKPAIYIYMKTPSLNNEARYYIGSSVKLANRICSHRCSVINWDKYKNRGSPIFYKSVKKYGWLKFKMAILEYLDLKDVTDTVQKRKILLLKEQYYLDNINPSFNARLATNLSLEAIPYTNSKFKYKI